MNIHASAQGSPCWYELSSRDLPGAEGFYGPLFGWRFQPSGMVGFDYHLAVKDSAMVAGLMDPGEALPDHWLIYFSVHNCDDSVAQAKILGATVYRAPEDIPGTGRYAILADPQGARFGLLASEDGSAGHAFDQDKTGHGNWHELHSSDPAAGFEFYAALLGWSATSAMDMGPDGKYQIFAQAGREIGGVMGMTGQSALPPYWLPYFGVDSAEAAMARVKELGGSVLHGPVEVPGDAYIVMAQDPRGTDFAVVGRK